MERILENSETYKNCLENSALGTAVVLGIAFVIAVIMAFVFMYWRKTIIRDTEEKAKKQRRTKRNKNGKPKKFKSIEWYAVLIIVVVLFLCNVIPNVQHIMELRYDMVNEAFVLHNGEFSVVGRAERMGFPGKSSTVYYVFFDNGAEVLEIPVSLERYEEFLKDGRHDDVAFVYSEKSKVLLDMWRK